MPRARGFTLIEMLVVCTVVVALAALSVPIIGHVRHGALVARTEGTVAAVAAAIAAHPARSVTARDAGGAVVGTWRLWDLDGDGLLDPDPRLAPAGFPSAAVAAGYHGPVAMLRPALPEGAVDAAGRIRDAWERPLRVYRPGDPRRATAPATGAETLALWSAGPDGRDDSDDDITSWGR